MAVTEAERLRQLLGEVVPPGGTAGDTLFTEAQIADLLQRHPFERAIVEGWKMKAAALANLVNTNESGTSRSLSKLYDNALEMVKYYGGGDDSGGGRVRIHKISRPSAR